MIFKRLILSATLLATTTTISVAQDAPAEPKQEIQALFWPNTARPKLGITAYHVEFDGIQVPMYLIQTGNLAFELANRKTLKVRDANSNRYSGELTDSRIPGVSLGISVFEKGEFLPDLSEASWAAYKAGLLIEKPTITVVLDNSNIESAITPYVFGEKFRQIVYENKSSQGIVKRREIFAFVGSKLLVFTINGTQESVDSNWSSIEHLIGEMTLN